MKKRRRDLIPAIFAKRDLDDVGKGIAIEDCADGIPHIEHQDSQTAVNFIRTGALGVGRLANASDRRQRSVDQPNGGAKLYPVHRTRKGVTTELSASALHVSRCLQLRENLFEKFDRQFFL